MTCRTFRTIRSSRSWVPGAVQVGLQPVGHPDPHGPPGMPLSMVPAASDLVHPLPVHSPLARACRHADPVHLGARQPGTPLHAASPAARQFTDRPDHLIMPTRWLIRPVRWLCKPVRWLSKPVRWSSKPVRWLTRPGGFSKLRLSKQHGACFSITPGQSTKRSADTSEWGGAEGALSLASSVFGIVLSCSIVYMHTHACARVCGLSQFPPTCSLCPATGLPCPHTSGVCRSLLVPTEASSIQATSLTRPDPFVSLP